MTRVARRAAYLASALVALATLPSASRAQLAPVTRRQAVDSALSHGARIGVALADTSLAAAQLLSARALQNPTLATDYSKSAPQYHATVEIPFDLPGVRGSRIGAARLGQVAARYRFAFERAAVALEADTAYTRAAAALAHARLSSRNARDADSLRHMAVERRDAGDASELDVQLAIVNAGQAANAAAADSLTFLSAVLDLQAVMGLGADAPVIEPVDSLTGPSSEAAPDSTLGGPTLSVAAAQAALQSAQLATRLQRRSVFQSPSLMAGVETGDPRGDEPGLLPTFGLSLPLPLLSRNEGGIAEATAEESRARAELTMATIESRTEIARARRTLSMATARVARDRELVAAAERVAAMSLTAYREGAATLPSVLEAQRNAREVLGAWIDDLADASIAAAELRVLTLTPSGASRPLTPSPSR